MACYSGDFSTFFVEGTLLGSAVGQRTISLPVATAGVAVCDCSNCSLIITAVQASAIGRSADIHTDHEGSNNVEPFQI